MPEDVSLSSDSAERFPGRPLLEPEVSLTRDSADRHVVSPEMRLALLQLHPASAVSGASMALPAPQVSPVPLPERRADEVTTIPEWQKLVTALTIAGVSGDLAQHLPGHLWLVGAVAGFAFARRLLRRV